MAITETKLNNNNVSNIDLNNYHFFHTDSTTMAGGAGLYISKDLQSVHRPDLKFSIPLVESCWSEILTDKRVPGIVVGCIYRHPSANLQEFTSNLENILKELNEKKYQIYILGDMNIDFLKYNEHTNTEEYLDMLYLNNLLPLITKPTRLTDHSSTLIDHIYTNTSIQNITSGIALVDISDHLPIFCICNTPARRNKRTIYLRDYSKFNQEKYISDINSINWTDMFNNHQDINEMTAECVGTIKRIIDKNAPKKQASLSKMKQMAKPWLTNGLLKSIRVKQKLYLTHFLSKNKNKISTYKVYSNLLNKTKTKAKNEYYSKQFQLNKNNLKTTWKLIGTLIKRKSKSQSFPSRIIRNNKVYTNHSDIAEQFNQHFINIGPNLANLITHTNDDPTKYINNSPVSSFYLTPISEEYVCQLFSKLNINKSSLDIPNKMIKLASRALSVPFTFIYNLSISTGIVPDIFKISRVSPVYKSGLMTDLNNYRPIAILSPFSKILERIVYDKLIIFLEKHSILTKFQFGFRKGHSTEQAILEITDNLKASIDNKLITCGIFLDFSKAFDTVNHKILLTKLSKYGIRGKPLEWFESYLTNRLQFVQIGNDQSNPLKMICGVPQGSTLGPLLFLLYINDIVNSSSILSFRIFADDANIFYADNDPKKLELVMNNELIKVFQYCGINKLSINMEKTKYMLITPSRKKQIHVNIHNIERKNCIKYLGIYLDEHLNWKSQIANVNNKITKNIGIFYKLRYCLDLHMLKQLYYTLIYPYLSYGAMSWGNTYKTNLTKIYAKQNKCVRSIFFANHMESSNKYFKILDILQFDNIVSLKIATFTNKLLNEPSNMPLVFQDLLIPISNVHSYNTRYSTRDNFYRPNVRTNYGKFTFNYTASKLWNSVPTNLKHLSASNFKRQYKRLLLFHQV